MKFNKQIAVILVLSSLLISAIGAALFLFYENENVKKANAQQITVFIANKDIKKDSLIKEEDISTTVIAKRYLLTKPILKKEIVNKFSKETIYKNELFRKEKLANEIGQTEMTSLPFKFNSYNASYKLFHNPNYSLIKGDILNIVSVFPKSKARDNLDYNVRYVAKQVKVLGFLEEGKIVEKGFRKVKKLVVPKKKNMKDANTKKYEMVKVFASELILDVEDKTILAMTEDYNKGKQLWMVKTNQTKDVPKKEVIKIQPMNKKSAPKVKRVYPYKRYIPRNISNTKTAVIEYADALIPNSKQQTVITTNLEKQCMDESKLLIGLSQKVYLRTIPSLSGKIKRIVYRHYIIPYTRQVDNNWYQVCDGRYVHKNEASPIDYKKAQVLLENKKPTKPMTSTKATTPIKVKDDGTKKIKQ